jgi:hypothetical protein
MVAPAVAKSLSPVNRLCMCTHLATCHAMAFETRHADSDGHRRDGHGSNDRARSLFRQPRRAATRSDQRREPGERHLSRSAESGIGYPVPRGAVAPTDRCGRSAAVLGVVQQCAKANPERRLGAPGDASGFGDFRDHLGVNMRLATGGIRELHWHLAAEWAYMTYGKCRVTVLDTRATPMSRT